MERDHVYSDPQYRSRLVEHQVRLRGCNIEAKVNRLIRINDSIFDVKKCSGGGRPASMESKAVVFFLKAVR